MIIEKRLEELKKRRRQAEQAYDLAQEEAGKPEAKVEPGRLFVFPLSGPLVLRWALILTHPEDPGLLYAVPGDDNRLAGSEDICIPDSLPAAPLTLRCAEGLWLREIDLRMRRAGCRPAGELPAAIVRRAHEKLARLATGDFSASAAQANVDESPAYEDWMELVVLARQELAARVFPKRKVIERIWAARPSPARDIPQTLAASGGIDSLAHELQEKQRASLLSIEDSPRWMLAAQRVEGGVRLVCRPAPGQPPPPVTHTGPEGQSVALSWKEMTEAGHFRTEPVVAWQDGEAQFEIELEEAVSLLLREEQAGER